MYKRQFCETLLGQIYIYIYIYSSGYARPRRSNRLVKNIVLVSGPKVAVTDYTVLGVTDYTPSMKGLTVWEHGTSQTSPGTTF